jgi:hypothetical protein
MVKRMDLDDFRAIRRVLDPDDFALSDGEPDPPPKDLIGEEAWDHIMTLPGDVAIRTTNHQGSRVALLYELSSEWVFSMPPRSITADAMLEISPNLDSSIFNTVHGHYKTALAVLRTALETSVIATRCALANDPTRWKDWNFGDEFKFGNNCDEILNLSAVAAQENLVTSQFGIGFFQESSRGKKDSWTRSLYARLCNYSHARGNTTDHSIWDSNGPIYSANGFRPCYEMFLETYALMLILAKWSHGRLGLKPSSRLVLQKRSLPLYLSNQFRPIAISYRDWLWKRYAWRPRTTATNRP